MEAIIKVAVAADHGGFEMKGELVKTLKKMRFEVKDFGTHNDESVDYPDFAHPVATAVKNGEYDYGILVCGTGNGMAITANKHEGVRAGLAWNEEVGALIKAHNNANIVCLPGRFISVDMAKNILKTFFKTKFEGDRHERRLNKINC